MVSQKPAYVPVDSSSHWGPVSSEYEPYSGSTSAQSTALPPAGASFGDSSMDEAEAEGAIHALALGEHIVQVETEGALPSIGAALHGMGSCKPCAWHWKPGGCRNGRECFHCHLCPEGELKARRRAKASTMRSGAALAQKVTLLSSICTVPELAMAPPPGLAVTMPPGLGVSLQAAQQWPHYAQPQEMKKLSECGSPTGPEELMEWNMPYNPKGSSGSQPPAQPTHKQHRRRHRPRQRATLGSPAPSWQKMAQVPWRPARGASP